jgi:sec-independent protein translocase protein TatA
MFGALGLTESLLIAAVLFLVFGAKRLPAIGKGLGQSISGFIAEIRGIEHGGSEKSAGMDRTEKPDSHG